MVTIDIRLATGGCVATGGLAVRIGFADPADAPVGLTVAANIIVDQREGVLTVPRTALRPDGSATGVFVVEDGAARLQPVTLVEWPAARLIVTSGLSRRPPRHYRRDGYRRGTGGRRGAALMLYALKIATRYLTANKAQTALLITGVAVGVFIFIFMSALIGGLAEFILSRTVGGISHITIQAEDRDPAVLIDAPGHVLTVTERGRTRTATLAEAETWLPLIEAVPGVRAVSPEIGGAGFLTRGAQVSQVSITGVLPGRESAILDLDGYIVEGIGAARVGADRAGRRPYRRPRAVAGPDGADSKLRRGHCASDAFRRFRHRERRDGREPAPSSACPWRARSSPCRRASPGSRSSSTT
jgi:hypothetical protein